MLISEGNASTGGAWLPPLVWPPVDLAVAETEIEEDDDE